MLKKLVMTALVITVLCQQAVASVVMLGAALESVTPVTAEMPACHSSQQSAHSGGAELQAFAQAGRLGSGALNSNTLKSIAPKINAHNGGGHPAGDHSCCKLKCSCCLMGCHAVFMAFHWSQAEMPSVYFLSSSFQSLAEHHPVSLYRPPIFA